MSIDSKVLRNEGQLDPAFGDGGLVLLNAPGAPKGSVNPKGMGVDADGRLYVVGDVQLKRQRVDYYCVRLTANGMIDPTFGKDGYVIAAFVENDEGRSYSQISEVVELSDGKILLIGHYYDGTFNTWKGLIRLHPDGTPDSTFGNNGTVLIALGSIGEIQAHSFQAPSTSSGIAAAGNSVILPDGKILLHEPVYDGVEETQTAIIRLTPDGALDPDFNQTGIVRIAFADFAHTHLTDVLVSADGKYVFSGYCRDLANEGSRALFTRLLATGATDVSFGDDGYRLIEPQEASMSFLLERLVAQTNQRLLGIGYTLDDAECGLLVSRESDGNANIQFNRGKPLLTRLDDRETYWHHASVQKDGSILVYGHIYKPAQVVVARFTDAGILDKNFGAGTGWLQFDADPFGMASALITDRTVLFFAAVRVNNHHQLGVARGLIAPQA